MQGSEISRIPTDSSTFFSLSCPHCYHHPLSGADSSHLDSKYNFLDTDYDHQDSVPWDRLKHLDLEGTPLRCSCHISWMLRLMIKIKTTLMTMIMVEKMLMLALKAIMISGVE